MKFETVVYEKLIEIVRRNKSIMTLSMSTRISSCRRISGGALAVRACSKKVWWYFRKKPTLWGCKSAGRRPSSWPSPPIPPAICLWRYATRKCCLSIPSRILDPCSRMMARPLVTLHLALPRLPLPCIAYTIHCFENTASAYKLRSTCIVPWLSPFRSMALKHGPPPSPIAGHIDVFFDMRCQRRLLRVFW